MLETLAPLIVVLGTATPGGGFPVYGAAVAETINAIDPSLAIQPRNTKGSTENVPLLAAGQLDLALVQGEVVHEALTGVGRPPGDRSRIASGRDLPYSCSSRTRLSTPPVLPQAHPTFRPRFCTSSHSRSGAK